MFQDMKVGTKLALGFGSVLVLMIGIIVTAYVALGSLGDAMRRIAEQDMVKMDLANIISTGARDNARLNLELFIADAQRRSSIAEQVEVNKKRIGEAMDKLDKLLYKPEGRAMFGRIKEARVAYVKSFSSVAKMVSEGKNAKATQLMVAETLPALQAFMNNVSELARFQTTLADQNASAAVATSDSAARLMVGAGIIAALVALVVGLWITRNLLKQLGGEPEYAAQIARKVAEGDLSVEISTKPGDSSSLLAAMKNMMEKLSQVIGEVRSAADALSSASEEVSATAQSLSQATNEQASGIEETSASIEQMSASINQNTENSKVTDGIAGKASTEALEGGEAVKGTVTAMKRIAEKISIIDDIAYQTNLLALNAAIEAARAGEHGKGFAVVAAEVRKLAERSQVAAQEIGTLAGSSVSLAESAGSLLDQIVPSIRKTAELVQEITAASQEQAQGTTQINTAMSQLSQTTQQNASASEELAATAEEMGSQAEQLQQLMSWFKVDHPANVVNLHSEKARHAKAHPVVKLARVEKPKVGQIHPIGQDEEREYVRF